MFENLVGQEVSKLISADIQNGNFPNSVLFQGSLSSGKLTAALEVARIFGCHAARKGDWNCECPSCLQHKSLVSMNMVLIGPRDCALEIQAAKDTFLSSVRQNAKYAKAARYLYIRSIRKLTLRFNGMLWAGNPNVNKIGSAIEGISEELEKIDFPRELLPIEELEKITSDINQRAIKLENEFLYDSIPIAQVRNMEDWARIKSSEGKKTVIIENADRMLVGVRNALLKILEEPPEDCLFILLTSRRNAVMPTILSRVRTYTFKDRTMAEQEKVIRLVFHNESFSGTIYDYLTSYLPVPISTLKAEADGFAQSVSLGRPCELQNLVKNCQKFEPRTELMLFLNCIADFFHPLILSPDGAACYGDVLFALRTAYENVTMYNLKPVDAALEILVRDLSRINAMNNRILRQCALNKGL